MMHLKGEFIILFKNEKIVITGSHFLQTIEVLLTSGVIRLFGKLEDFEQEECAEIAMLLEGYYEKDSLHYPHTPPRFDSEAGVLGAKILYLSAQLILYRDLTAEEAIKLFPADDLEKTPSAILSADLCLRFMPAILTKYAEMQPEDSLLPQLQQVMEKWCYSALGYHQEFIPSQWEPVFPNPCLLQLTVDRIIERRVLSHALSEEFLPYVSGALGDYGSHFWKEFNEKKGGLKLPSTTPT